VTPFDPGPPPTAGPPASSEVPGQARDGDPTNRGSFAMTFPITDASPIRFADALPPRVDVAIIGGGVIGVMTAWFLRQKGLSVLVLRKRPHRGRTVQPQLGLGAPAGP
jgi:NADPH-dependent 2,4-dienoyl-CoA reductase/sulfur reductase-like enzyme